MKGSFKESMGVLGLLGLGFRVEGSGFRGSFTGSFRGIFLGFCRIPLKGCIRLRASELLGFRGV